MATMTVYENTETRVVLNVHFTDPTMSRRFSIYRSGASAPLSSGWMDSSENVRISLAVPDKLMYNTTYTLEARFDGGSTFATCTFTTKHSDGSGGTDPDPDPNPPSGNTPWHGQDPAVENDPPGTCDHDIENIAVIYSGNKAYLRFDLVSWWYSPMIWPNHGRFTFTVTFPDGSTVKRQFPEGDDRAWVKVETWEHGGCRATTTKATVTIGDYYIGQKGALPANKVLPIKVVANSFGYYYNGDHTGGFSLNYDWDIEVDYRKAARPEKFYWKDNHANITKGETVANVITAAKWIELQNNVNAVREIVGTGASATPISFGAPHSGEVITAAMYNKVVQAINDVGGNIPKVSQYSIMTSTSMMNLQNTINSIG